MCTSWLLRAEWLQSQNRDTQNIWLKVQRVSCQSRAHGGCPDTQCAQEAADILGEMEDLQERVSSAQAGQSKAETESTALRRQLALAKAQVISASGQPGSLVSLRSMRSGCAE